MEGGGLVRIVSVNLSDVEVQGEGDYGSVDTNGRRGGNENENDFKATPDLRLSFFFA